MASNQTIQPYNYPSTDASLIVPMRDWNGYVVAEESHVEFEDIQKSWKPEDIAKYLIKVKSKEKAVIVAKRMAGIWYQMASMGMASRTLKDSEGNILLSVTQGYEKVLEYFINTAEQLYEAIEDVEESKYELELLDKKISRSKADGEYEEMVLSIIGNCQSVFAEYSLREKIPALCKLSDMGYHEFCLRFVSCNISEAVAIAYCAGFYRYTTNQLKNNKEGMENAIFSSNDKVHEMIVKAKGQSTSSNVKKEYQTIISENINTRSSHKAWQYTEEAQCFLDNLH